VDSPGAGVSVDSVAVLPVVAAVSHAVAAVTVVAADTGKPLISHISARTGSVIELRSESLFVFWAALMIQ
jgi:hypothetical protein